MGRKIFRRHLCDAAGSPPPNIFNVHSPEEGLIGFLYTYIKDGVRRETPIRILATDIDSYPDGIVYMIYTEDDAVDPIIPSTFDILTPVLHGKSIQTALAEVSRGLADAILRGEAKNPTALNDDPEESDVDDFLDDADEDDGFGLNDYQSGAFPNFSLSLAAHVSSRVSLSHATTNLDRIRSDLRATKEAGFRVGIIGSLAAGSIVCVSVRVTKLGISEEAMQAWGLRRKQYLVLMIRFQQGYRDLEQVKEDNTLQGQTEMRVALCESYKPTRADALAAFNQVNRGDEELSKDKYAVLEPLFIGRPLNDLMRDRFAQIVKFRESCCFNWLSAESFVNDIQGKGLNAVDNTDLDKYYLEDTTTKTFPAMVIADAMEGKLLKHVSLPLVAMQFLLRHFVRCTEFCLICHTKVPDTFEALKPYVCTKPLCLWQYMTYGFGPSIEWELLSQPYVVDLLVSFCYAAARGGRLKEFPIGIDLTVPFLPHYNDSLPHVLSHGYQPKPKKEEKKAKEISPKASFKAWLDFPARELLVSESQSLLCEPLKAGDWLVVRSLGADEDYHHRVDEAMHPVFRLSPPITVKRSSYTKETPSYAVKNTPDASRSTTPAAAVPGYQGVECYRYSHSFDALTDDQKHWSIVTLLETLPPVLEMQKFLEESQKGQDPSLRSWVSRIPKSSLNLLRWVIASNRSCILQVDRLVQDGSSSKLSRTSDDRVAGMDNYMQFRFAQGAPDKEQRFIDCVNEEHAASGKQWSTIFAWHGSPLYNWHSIIREGLRFDNVAHGRAYGDGVYLSLHASTSIGYSGGLYGGVGGGLPWPQSVLKISQAFSLNEVVNVPDKFVHQQTHLVIDKIDWIQTRYLFVKSELSHSTASGKSIEYNQDPSRQALNSEQKPVQIPITAVSKSRRPVIAPTVAANGIKKSKHLAVTDQATAEQQEDDANSEISDEDDRDFLESDLEQDDDGFDTMSLDGEEYYETEATAPQPSSKGKKRALDTSQTDFVPGTLDVSKIRFFQPPADATPAATKALMKALQEALNVQESTPLHQLGWYINPDHVTNMYQWIVELHSFNANLPLARDMKAADVSSVVLEIRFTKEFPFSPPFIRVVCPRFLPFQQGGGGHVTDGGAICMELLTNNGWSAVNSIESVLLQVRLALCDEERPARLTAGTRGGKAHMFDRGGSDRGSSYAIGEALVAFERACRTHGWTVPKGFATLKEDGYKG